LQTIISDAEVVNRYGIRMLQSSCRLCFTAKTFSSFQIALLRVKDLNGHFVTDQQSSRAIDCAHATRAEFSGDSILSGNRGTEQKISLTIQKDGFLRCSTRL